MNTTATKTALIIVGDQVEEMDVFVPMFAMQAIGWDVQIVSVNKSKCDTVQTSIHECRGTILIFALK